MGIVHYNTLLSPYLPCLNLYYNPYFIVHFFFQIYPGFYHKLLNEPKEDRELVMNDIITWIKERLPSADTSG